MKEEIKQSLLNGIMNEEFSSSFSDVLFDNIDQVSECLANQEILMNREVILIHKHYSGETKILTDTYCASKKTDLAKSVKTIMETKEKHKAYALEYKSKLNRIPSWIRWICNAN